MLKVRISWLMSQFGDRIKCLYTVVYCESLLRQGHSERTREYTIVAFSIANGPYSTSGGALGRSECTARAARPFLYNLYPALTTCNFARRQWQRLRTA